MLKKALLGTLVLILGLLSGCGKTENTVETVQKQPPSQASVPKTIEELAVYNGKDWEDVLKKGAQEEGTLSIYAGIPADTAQPFVDAFSKKYGIKVNLWRGKSEDVRTRIISEYEGKHYAVDVVLGGATKDYDILARHGHLQPFKVPSSQGYSAKLTGKNNTWYSFYNAFFTLEYNTNLVKAAEAPKTYQDLLDPKWKGKLGIEGNDVDWFATLVKHMGESKGLEFFSKLSEQQLSVRSGHTLLSSLVASGEVPVAITAYNYRAQLDKDKGAPVEWVPLQPVVAILNGCALAAKAQHPNASLLFLNFILSKEGQELVRKGGQVPASTEVPANPPKLNTGFDYIPVDTTSLIDEFEKWQKLWDDIIIKRSPAQPAQKK